MSEIQNNLTHGKCGCNIGFNENQELTDREAPHKMANILQEMSIEEIRQVHPWR